MKQWPVLLISTFILQGCGGSARTQHPQLTMWLVGSEAQARTINQVAEAFTARTGVRVRCETIAWGEAHSKYLTAIAGGVEPDLGAMGLTWGIEFGRLGALVNLREAFPEDIAVIQRSTFPGLWESIERDGDVYGIPFDLSLQILFYRTDLVPRAPHTWQELTETLERLGLEKRRMILDWGNLSWIGYAPFLWQAGGDIYNAQQTAVTLDSPEAVRALTFFRDLYLRYNVPRTSVPLEEGLRTGDFPLAISGNWKIISLTTGAPDIAGKWAIGLLPKGPSGKRTAFLGGRTIGIFARSKRQHEAWAFLRYLFEPEVQVELYQAALASYDAYLPPNIAAWERLPMDPGMKTILLQQARETKGPPAVIGWTETTHIVESAIQNVVLNNADPATELKVASEALTRHLK